jgi:all-trans-retinol 13,14-reductase
MPSALIIGSGVSGLTSAVLLAEHGWQVTVLEAHAIPGGLMQRFRRGPYWFDTGFHFITGGGPGGPFRPLAARLGILEGMRFLPHDLAHQFRVHMPAGGHVDLPAGLAECEDACAARWAGQAAGIRRFFAELRGCLAAKPWLAMLVPDGTPPPTVDTDLPVNAVLDLCGVGGDAKAVLGCLTGILAMTPDRCPLGLYAAFAGTSISGSWRAEGGGEAVIRPLVARLKALGGTLLVNRGAERIHYNEREVEAVEDVKGQRHVADLVLATCHPAEVLRLTGEDGLRPSLVERIRGTPDSASVALVYAALSKPPAALGRIHHFARLGDQDGLYYLAPSNFYDEGDPGAAHPYLETMLWVPGAAVAEWRASDKGRRPEAYEAWKRKMEADLLGAITARHPEIAGTVTRVWSSTPLSVEYYVRSRGGGAMGLSHDVGFLGTDPMPRRSRLKNLFFAGQNVGHPGVLGAMIDGFVMAGSFIGKDLSADVTAGAGPTR